jgi:hypothetical protein
LSARIPKPQTLSNQQREVPEYAIGRDAYFAGFSAANILDLILAFGGHRYILGSRARSNRERISKCAAEEKQDRVFPAKMKRAGDTATPPHVKIGEQTLLAEYFCRESAT